MSTRSSQSPLPGALSHRILSLGLLFACSLPACKSAAEYAAEADEQVYGLVEARRATLFAEEGAFSIEPNPDSLRHRIVSGEVAALNDLGLAECMEIAAENNRDYQTRKERLYLVALDLTLERWRLGWIPGAFADGDLSGLGSEATSADAGGTLGLSRVLGTGAQVVGAIGLNVFKDLLSGDAWEATSSFSLLFTQPLLRGAGKLIVYEPLTQAERDLVYEVRDFERFRRQLSVDIATRLLRILQQTNTIENEQSNFSQVQDIRVRNEALSDAGRLSLVQVDQALQDELSSESRLIDVIQVYASLLDDLKLFLGLPPTVEVSIRQSELQRLVDQGLEPASHDSDEVIATALQNRPDFMTAVDTVVDGERRSRVVADALRMGFDLTSSISGDSEAGEPLKYNFKDVQWSLGLSLDLPVNRLPERNAYRAALITWQRSTRNAQLLSDQISVDLRNELRDLDARRESYEIQINAVKLAQQRVESTQLNQKAGRASTRDLLEAQSALVSSQNAQTRALIDFTLARLQLALDMGLLRVHEDGLRLADPELIESESPAIASEPQPDPSPEEGESE
ncbi:MAG: outer membrane protein TolC [Chlamydiales bacterium]|jgi:outer membrane protein TolC